MIIPNSDRETHVERWLEIRSTGLTATEISYIAAGKKSIQAIWHEKQTGATIPDNPFMAWGRLQEPHILDWLRQETDGQTIVANSHIAASDDDNRCLSTPDGFMDGAVIECKTTGKSFDGLRDESKPMVERFREINHLDYYYQCQWQMYTADVDECVFCWQMRELAPCVEQDGQKFFLNFQPVVDPLLIFMPGDLGMVTIPRDDGAISLLKALKDEFFAYEGEDEPTIPENAVQLMRSAKQHEELAKKLKAEAMEIVQPLLNVGDKVTGDWGSVSCSERKTSRIDSKRLKNDHPDIAREYTTETVSRQIRFTIKD